MKRFPLVLGLFSLIFLFASCNVNVVIKQNKNGSVDVKLGAGAGEAFTKMILAATGGTTENFFDTKEIQYELAKSGFSKVNVQTKTGTDIDVNLTDANKTSYLFTSGILSEDKSGLKMNLNAKALKTFYDLADEQTQMVLDLLVAPVFSGDDSSQNEYLELIESFYGEGAAKEIKTSIVDITIINADGNKTTKKLPLVDLVTLNEDIKL